MFGDFFKFIKDNAMPIVSVIATSLLAIYTTRKNISINDKMKLLEIKSNKQLQIESFNRELNGKMMFELLDEWLDFLFDQENPRYKQKIDMDKPDYMKFLNDFNRRTVLFGSGDTISIYGKYMKFNYNGTSETYGAEKYLVLITFVSAMISSLKKDFTGVESGIMDYIDIKITDAYLHEGTIQKLYESMDLKKYGIQLRA